MHAKIIEIGTKKLKRADYITEDNFIPEEYGDFADYIQGVEKEIEKKVIAWFDDLEFFTRKGRELTLQPMGGFMDDWKMKIVDMANNLDFTDWFSFYDIKDVMKKTHEKWVGKICMNGEEFWDFGYFCQYIYENYKPGDKFYIGGILDYHY